MVYHLIHHQNLIHHEGLIFRLKPIIKTISLLCNYILNFHLFSHMVTNGPNGFGLRVKFREKKDCMKILIIIPIKHNKDKWFGRFATNTNHHHFNGAKLFKVLLMNKTLNHVCWYKFENCKGRVNVLNQWLSLCQPSRQTSNLPFQICYGPWPQNLLTLTCVTIFRQGEKLITKVMLTIKIIVKNPWLLVRSQWIYLYALLTTS